MKLKLKALDSFFYLIAQKKLCNTIELIFLL